MLSPRFDRLDHGAVLRALVRRLRRAPGCRSCSRCGRHRARRHCGNACGSARNVSSTVVTVWAPFFRQPTVSARSPCRSMTASSLPQRPVRASVAFSVSIASRRTVPGRVLARDRATIRWAADGGFGDRVGCIPPDRPMSQGYPGRLTVKETAGAAAAEAAAIRDNTTLRPSVGSDPLIRSRAES